MTGQSTMMVPRDVLRFEALLYVSLILDAVSAAFVGVDDESRASLSALNAFLISGFFVLVWLAAQRQKNWARWTLFGFFVFTVVVYIASFGELAFGVGTIFDILSLGASALGFYYGFTSEAQRWFKGANP